MNSWSLYSYLDYEEAYFSLQYRKCKEIGIYLLSHLVDEHSKQLLHQLENYDYADEEHRARDDKLLWDVKVWLMVND